MAILDTETQVSFFVGDFGSGLDHPECVACGPDGTAYAGGEAGQVYRVDMENRTFEEYANTGAFVGGMAVDATHHVYACSGGEVKRITPDGRVSTYTAGSDERTMMTPNYPAFDAHGNLYVSDSGAWKEDNGCLYRVAPGGKAEVWCNALTEFPNGVCLHPEGDYLYVAVSLNSPRLARVKIESDGTAGEAETVVLLPEAVPDGLAFDTDGNLYISCYRPDRVYRLSASGDLEVLAEDFEGTVMAAPTNVAFCGSNRDVLLSANLGRWHLACYDVKATGAALHYPDIS